MTDHEGRLQWLLTILLALAVLFAASFLGGPAYGGWIYDVTGVMAPTLANPVSVSFVGEMEFPEDTATEGELRLNLTNEFDLITGEPVTRTVPFQMSGTEVSPFGIRRFMGEYDFDFVEMTWIDTDQDVFNDFDASTLEGGGGWEAFGITFVDYQLGSFTSLTNRRETPVVNEPAGMALGLIGLLALVGLVREKGFSAFN